MEPAIRRQCEFAALRLLFVRSLIFCVLDWLCIKKFHGLMLPLASRHKEMQNLAKAQCCCVDQDTTATGHVLDDALPIGLVSVQVNLLGIRIKAKTGNGFGDILERIDRREPTIIDRYANKGEICSRKLRRYRWQLP